MLSGHEKDMFSLQICVLQLTCFCSSSQEEAAGSTTKSLELWLSLISFVFEMTTNGRNNHCNMINNNYSPLDQSCFLKLLGSRPLFYLWDPGRCLGSDKWMHTSDVPKL